MFDYDPVITLTALGKSTERRHKVENPQDFCLRENQFKVLGCTMEETLTSDDKIMIDIIRLKKIIPCRERGNGSKISYLKSFTVL